MGITRRQDIKILRLEYTSVALRSHTRSVIAGVPKEVSKSPKWTNDTSSLFELRRTNDRFAEGQKTMGITRRQDIKILRLEYTSVALRSHPRSVIAGVPKEVSKSP